MATIPLCHYITIPEVPIWVEFFDTYRGLPELWNIMSDDFKNRKKRNIALNKLLNVYNKIQPNANVSNLRKRLSNIRICYRRELKKVIQSQSFGTETNDKYVPTLWYYENLNFLRDQTKQISVLSTRNHEHIEVKDEPTEESDEDSAGTPTSHSCSHKRKKSVDQQMVNRNDRLSEAPSQLSEKVQDNNAIRDRKTQLSILSTDHKCMEVKVEPTDEFDENSHGTHNSYSYSHERKSVDQQMMKENTRLNETLGQLNETQKETNNVDDVNVYVKGWVISYRKLSPIQQIYAKKAIDDILILGQLKLLSLHSVNYPAPIDSSKSFITKKFLNSLDPVTS